MIRDSVDTAFNDGTRLALQHHLASTGFDELVVANLVFGLASIETKRCVSNRVVEVVRFKQERVYGCADTHLFCFFGLLLMLEVHRRFVERLELGSIEVRERAVFFLRDV
jgi:hypothetical protein